MLILLQWCLPALGIGLFFRKRGTKAPLNLSQPCLGRNQSMVGIFQGRMEDVLLNYLQDTSILRMSEAEVEEHGFACCVDYRKKPGHIYYEGYFHASPNSQGTMATINPRTGRTFDKPPAPSRLRAFFQAFRVLNAPLFADLAESVRALGEACHPIAALYDPNGGALLGDLAVQLHCGDEIKDEDLGWHVDNVNSSIHMALTLGGTRALHYLLTPPSHGDTPDPWGVRHEWTWFTPGDFYCSSPAFFTHSVEFPEADWSHRSISLQARLLLTREQHETLAVFRQGELMPKVFRSLCYDKVCALVASVLCSGNLCVPSLAAVQEQEATMTEYEGPFPVFESERGKYDNI